MSGKSQTTHGKITDNIFKFTIFIKISCDIYLDNTITSIINQTMDFKNNIQVILLIDTYKTPINIDEYIRRYPENITVIHLKDSANHITNKSELIKGKYVSLINCGDYITSTTLENTYNYLEEYFDEIDLVSIPVYTTDKHVPDNLNYKFSTSNVINLVNKPNNPLTYLKSTFIKKDVLLSVYSENNHEQLPGSTVINQIILKRLKYGVLSTDKYYANTINNPHVENILDYMDNYLIKLLNIVRDNKNSFPYISYLITYELQNIIRIHTLDMLNNKEKKLFWNKLEYLLSFINEQYIINNPNITSENKTFLLYLINKDENTIITTSSNDAVIKIKDYDIDRLSNNKIIIDIAEIKDDVLDIEGCYSSSFNNQRIDVKLIVNTKSDSHEYNPEYITYDSPERSNIQHISITWKYIKNFVFKIPLEKNVNATYTLEIVLKHGGERIVYKPLISFGGSASISMSTPYHVRDDKILSFKDNKLQVEKYSFHKMIKYEAKSLMKILHEKKKGYMHALKLHLLYLILYPYMNNKKIWLFMDRSDSADDNAKYLFEYCNSAEDNIIKYFVISNECRDYAKLNDKYDNIICFQSLKHELLYLFAKKNISSYVNDFHTNPFYDKNNQLYRGIARPDKIFLQHGVTKDNISEYTNKYKKNVSLLTTVSTLEHDAFLRENYNYDENVVQVLGFPRYDSLTSQPEKIVLFAPTWRNNINSAEKFINSGYYEMIQEVLSSKQLENTIKETGYRLVFKAHPLLEEYVDLLNIPDYIIVSRNESYQELFRKSSLLITDYSSVFFDFAYLKKPVIYYHPIKDYHYRGGYYNYDTMGFGEVCVTENKLISIIEKYLSNDCIMEDEYKSRVDAFFKYHDSSNCMRVYKWLLKH